ncbi:MAG: protocatechuate 3,4-dioxygenase beta subunit, partial [Chlamydiales bacterium]
MRPLLVLILIVAALGAFYVAFSGDSTDTQTQGLSPDARPTTPVGTADDAQLVGPDAVLEDRRAQPVAELDQPQAIDDRKGFKNRLTGRVVDEDNNPIADASVVLTKWGRSTFFFTEDDGSWDRSDDRSAKTDAEGVYQFDDLPAFNGFALVASHDDYGTTEVGEVGMEDSGLFEEPPIVLHPGFKVWGVITDTGGNIVPSASVVLSLPNLGSDPMDGPETKRLKSDATGGYEIKSVSPGMYALTVTADGYGRLIMQKVQIEEGQDLELNVELAVAQMIAGRVTSPGGIGVPGAKIQAYSMPGRGKMSRSQTLSDENGEFRFEDIPAGSYTIMASQKGFNHDRKQRIETGNMSLVIELIPLPSVSGRVVDADTGNPVPGCLIRLRQAGSPGEVSMPVSGTNGTSKGKDALFTVNPPNAGKYIAEASSATYATCFSEPFSIAQGQVLTDIVVRMSRGGKIVGRIVDPSGKGVGGVVIETQDNDWTDDQFMRA